MSQGDIRPPERPLSRIPFSPRAEQTIRALANWMQVAAVISMVAAGAKLVAAFTSRRDFSYVVDAVVTFLIGLWVYQAGVAFRRVATTDTADQHYLMEGFTLLRRVYLLQSILVIIVLASVVVAIVVAATYVATHGPRAA